MRSQFLSAIFDALNKDPQEHSKPLDLDFVYGSLNDDAGKKFWPLDGQQRLTTLYLLHWYLACQDGESRAFQELALSDGKSRFTYETRRSSAEFFSALASHTVDLNGLPAPSEKSDSLSCSIRDYAWFFLSWDMDPTIQSALCMLDAIDTQFRGEQGLYSRITQAENPYITFQFLNLEEFGLSDELYIKMNARGKVLTPFENFKAKFEQYTADVCHEDTRELHGRSMPLREYLARKIDTDWSDLFWQFSGGDTERFDGQVLQFFRSMITILYPLGRTREERDEVSIVLGAIRESNFNPSFYQYAKLACLDRTLVINLIAFMDTVCTHEETFRTFLEDVAYYDEKATFRFALESLETRGKNPRGLTYQRAMMFFAWCIYIIRHSENIESSALFDWMRVVHNLTENTRVEAPRELTEALFSIIDLSEHADSIITFLALMDEEHKVSFFYVPQVREERIKAQMMRRSFEWRQVLMRGEQHGYFKGQIEFLLEYSGVLKYFLEDGSCDWGEAQDQHYLQLFTEYLDKSEAVFDQSGLRKFPDNLLERALLTKGDYLLYGRSNYSFLDDDDRDTSWKRLLRGSERAADTNRTSEKRKLLGQLLESLDIVDVENSLRKVIDAAELVNDWRLPFIVRPELISYCEKRYIRRNSDDLIYLMKRIQMNGAHLELWTYDLFLDYVAKIDNLHPFDQANTFESYSNYEEPGIRLFGMQYNDTSVNLDITYQNGRYLITLDKSALMPELEGFMDFEENSLGYPVTRIQKDAFRMKFPFLLSRLAELASSQRGEAAEDGD